MNNEFVPYEQALALKELGFDEPSLGYYTSTGYYNSKKELRWRKWIFNYSFRPISNEELTYKDSEVEKVQQVVSPLYQQVFSWFRENYGLHYVVCKNIQIDGYGYREVVQIPYMVEDINTTFKTYEEAGLACLIKLIEICRKK